MKIGSAFLFECMLIDEKQFKQAFCNLRSLMIVTIW